jgi:hypothetical protein
MQTTSVSLINCWLCTHTCKTNRHLGKWCGAGKIDGEGSRSHRHEKIHACTVEEKKCFGSIIEITMPQYFRYLVTGMVSIKMMIQI